MTLVMEERRKIEGRKFVLELPFSRQARTTKLRESLMLRGARPNWVLGPTRVRNNFRSQSRLVGIGNIQMTELSTATFLHASPANVQAQMRRICLPRLMLEYHLVPIGGRQTTMAVLSPALLGIEKTEAGVRDRTRG